MTITVNNKSYNSKENATLQSLLEELNYTSKTGVAIAINNTVTPRQEWDKTIIKEGDNITIFRASCGG